MGNLFDKKDNIMKPLTFYERYENYIDSMKEANYTDEQVYEKLVETLRIAHIKKAGRPPRREWADRTMLGYEGQLAIYNSRLQGYETEAKYLLEEYNLRHDIPEIKEFLELNDKWNNVNISGRILSSNVEAIEEQLLKMLDKVQSLKKYENKK